MYMIFLMREIIIPSDKDGGIPALEEIKFSLTSNRGCFGGCSFCALTFHQGRILQTRSHESILKEAVHMTQEERFQRIYPRCRWTYSRLSPAFLPETANQRRLQEPSLSVS